MAIAPVLSVLRPVGPTSGPPPSLPEQEVERLKQEILSERLDGASALDFIVRRVCTLTQASGAAIALQTEDLMVCVASYGSAPDVGVTLGQLAGLSGECVRTGALVHCRDAVTDPRTNPLASLRLQLRSAVVLPIRKGEQWLGLVEILSSSPNAFHGSDVLLLQRVAGLIAAVATINDSEKTASPSPGAAPDSGPKSQPAPALSPSPPPDTANVSTATLKVPPQRSPAAVGRAPVRASAQPPQPVHARTSRSPKPRTAIVVRPLLRSALMVWLTAALLFAGRLTYRSNTTIASPTTTEAPSAQRPSGAGTTLDLLAGLDGFVGEARSWVGALASAVISRFSSTDTPQLQTYSATPPVVTQGRLLESVQPVYPKAARDQGLRGTVVLHVRVGKNGRVQQVSTVRGNPILGAAASDAVKRWRYRPFLLNDQPVEGEIVVSINFLPPKN